MQTASIVYGSLGRGEQSEEVRRGCGRGCCVCCVAVMCTVCRPYCSTWQHNETRSGRWRDSLFPAHEEQEIFRVQCLTQCWTLHTSTESIYLTGRKSPLKASFLLNMSMFPGTLISTFKVTRSSGMVLLWNDPMSSWAEGFETARSTILGDSGNLRRWDLAGSRSLREPVRAPCLVPSLASFSHEVNSSPPPHTEQAWRSGSDETQSPKQSFSSQAVGRTVTVMHK